MQNFTNEVIEINELPKFEEVKLKGLHNKYIKVLLFNFFVFSGLIYTAYFVLYFLNPFDWKNYSFYILFPILVSISVFWYFYIGLSFKKKGFAFRDYDAIYKSGLISETTTVIPFNRVQHVALHQGFVSSKLGLAAVELFTARGESSDLKIPGLLLEEAQQIKNLISQKINPPKDDFNEKENLIADTNE